MVKTDQTPEEWSFLKKLLLGFFFLFFLFYIVLNPNEVVPYSYYIHKLYIQFGNRCVVWLSVDIFHLVNPAVKFYNGTIDTVFGYLTVLFIGIAAIAGSVIWVITGNKRYNYNRLYQLLLIVLRYYLAISWIAYGSIKLIRLQFPPLSPAMLVQTYGNSTPKELAWAFMGYSNGYNYFIGITEYTIGLLLFFRRTSTLGNFFGIVLLANVLAFNYTYGVNVKLLSTMLMAMSLFLLTKDIPRLIDFFFLNKTVHPANDAPFSFKIKWKDRCYKSLKYLFIVAVIFFDLHGDFAREKKLDADYIKPPLYGLYNITAFNKNLDITKPSTNDTSRWNKLIISSPTGSASVLLMDNTFKNFSIKVDTAKKKIELIAVNDISTHYHFNYTLTTDSVLTLNGKLHDDSLEIKLKEFDINKFPLVNKRFQWIIDWNYKKQN